MNNFQQKFPVYVRLHVCITLHMLALFSFETPQWRQSVFLLWSMEMTCSTLIHRCRKCQKLCGFFPKSTYTCLWHSSSTLYWLYSSPSYLKPTRHSVYVCIYAQISYGAWISVSMHGLTLKADYSLCILYVETDRYGLYRHSGETVPLGAPTEIHWQGGGTLNSVTTPLLIRRTAQTITFWEVLWWCVQNSCPVY